MNIAVKNLVKKSFIGLIVTLQITAFPLVTYAEETATPPADTSSETSVTPTVPEPAPVPLPAPTPDPTPAPAPSPEPAPSSPPATPNLSATTPPPTQQTVPYTLNPETGMYENDKYIWDPVTFQTKPKLAPTYSYNTSTGMWETTQWRYDQSSGNYIPNIVAVSPNPPIENAKVSNSDTSPILPVSPLYAPSGQSSPLMSRGGLGTSSYNSSNDLSPDNNSPVSDAFFGAFYNSQISNSIYSTARSGDVDVTQNTVAGNALSGNASAIANIINILQSSWGPGGSGNISTFVANIDGDVVGDLMIDPGQLTNQSLAVANGPDSDVKVNVENNGNINNDIQLTAQTGNASVNNNTLAGSAQSGNATAMANVINVINSTIASGQSFFGVLNINGNFDGDILMPPNILDYLLASSTPKTTISVPSSQLAADLTNNQSINNNLSTSAVSGQANVTNNTSAGNATSGDATTDVTILNLTGSNIIASNSLLVFVNVLGEWVGLIVNTPAGSNSAAYAGGNITNAPLSNAHDADVDITNNSTINNNINVSARSGDATVNKNTEAGDAISGDAKAGINLLNIMNSNLALSDWFGVLFINVLGSWHGSFGINTAAGGSSVSPSDPENNAAPNTTLTFRPSARTMPVSTASVQRLNTNNVELVADEDNNGIVAGVASTGNSTPPTQTPILETTKSNMTAWILSGIIAALAIAYLVWRRINSQRSRPPSGSSQVPVGGQAIG